MNGDGRSPIQAFFTDWKVTGGFGGTTTNLRFASYYTDKGAPMSPPIGGGGPVFGGGGHGF